MTQRPPWLMRLHEQRRVREVREYLGPPGSVTYISRLERESTVKRLLAMVFR